MSNVAPTRSNRQRCWDNRDLYYACLAKNSILVPPGTDMSDTKGPLGQGKFAEPSRSAAERAKIAEEERRTDPCVTERNAYEGSCAHSWVRCWPTNRLIDYFNKRRVLEERQKTFYADAEARVAARK